MIALARWLLAALLMGWLAAPHWSAQIDDVFISARFAAEWANTGQLAWSGGERVEGFSNPLWVLMLRAAWATPFDPGLLAQCLSLAAALGLLALLSWRLPRDASGHLLLLGAACVEPLAYWAAMGMETVTFTLVASAGYACSLAPGRARRLGPWLGAVAALTRPEGLAWLGLSLCALWLRPAAHREPRELRTAALALLLPAAYQLFRSSYFDAALPTAAFLKPQLGVRGLQQLTLEGLTLLPMLALAMACRRLPRRDVAWALAPLVLSGAVLCALNGDWMGHGRLLLPGALGSLLATTSLGEPRRPGTTVLGLLGTACVLAGLHQAPCMEPLRWRELTAAPWSAYARGLNTPLEAQLRWLVENAPADALVQAADVGMLSHIPRLRVLDSRGLCSRAFRDAIRSQHWAPIEQLYASPERPQIVQVLRVAPPGTPPPEPPTGLDPWLAGLDATLHARYPFTTDLTTREGRWLGATRYFRFDDARPDAALVAERWRGLAHRFPAQPLFARELARVSRQLPR